MMKRRPTLAELAQESQGDSLRCPRCGCRDWRVVDSRQGVDSLQVRKRACRHCNFLMPHSTKEVAVPEGFRVIVVPEEDPGDVEATIALTRLA